MKPSPLYKNITTGQVILDKSEAASYKGVALKTAIFSVEDTLPENSSRTLSTLFFRRLAIPDNSLSSSPILRIWMQC